MEEQIPRYCLKLIKKLSLFLVLFFCIYLIYFFQIQEINSNNNLISIKKGSNLKEISSLVLKDNSLFNKRVFYFYLKIWNTFINKIDYGEFQLRENSNLIEITKIISQPSNVYYKLTIVDGWQEYQLNRLFKNKFDETILINYNDILADTYKYKSTDTIQNIVDLMKKNKKNFFKKHLKNNLFNKYSIKEIMIIASLVEKEGLDDEDKKNISSVIFNRINRNLKLQIDASTIYSITKGKHKFIRKLTYNDLKIEDQYNTYYISGLPPQPICFVSRKTIELVLENYKSEYLFYFYNEILKTHEFSKSFKDHRSKLINYRKTNEK